MKNFIKIVKNKLYKPKYMFKSIGKNVEIDKSNRFYSSQNIEIGDNVYIGFDGIFWGYGGIKIGNGTIIAHKVELLTRNHNYESFDLKSIPYDQRFIMKPIVIEENVWIGSNVKVVPGITIGEGSIIGMGSVVTKNIPKYAVVGGNPAKIIKYRDMDIYNKLKNQDKIYLKLKNQIK